MKLPLTCALCAVAAALAWFALPESRAPLDSDSDVSGAQRAQPAPPDEVAEEEEEEEEGASGETWQIANEDAVLPASDSPGTDTCLGMSWEPTIAVDPNAPMVIAVAQGSSIVASFDAGGTFTQTLNPNPPAAWASGGDASLTFDTQGRLFITYLGSPPTGLPGREVFITGYQRIGNQFQLIPGTAWPVSVTASAGLGIPNNADKEWIVADTSPTSQYTDRLYVVWADIDQTPWRIYVAYSSDQGASWTLSTSNVLNLADEGPRCWAPHIAAAANGDVYVSWHSQTGFLDANFRVPDGMSGQAVVRRSKDGGNSFNARSFALGPGDADVTWNIQHSPNGRLIGADFWNVGSAMCWLLCDPFDEDIVHVVTCDDPDNNVDFGDPADIVITTSTDQGLTWSPSKTVSGGPLGTFQLLPSAAIDPMSGSLGVIYYSNENLLDANSDGFFELDLISRSSFSGGTFWGPSIDVNDGTLDPQNSTSCRFCCNSASSCWGQPITRRIGEYNGLAFGECTGYMVWADDACNPGGSNLDIFFDDDPEMGGDLTAPVLTCPPDMSLGCNDSTLPRDLGGPATAVDDCDLDPSVIYVDMPLPGFCPPGTVIGYIQRIWSATDAAGNIATCAQTLTITDFDPPLINVAAPLVMECAGPGTTSINDPTIAAWLASTTAIDECSQTTLTSSAPQKFFTICPGDDATTIIFSASDECGNSDFAVSSVAIVDSTPPTLTVTRQKAVLNPANGGLVDVGLMVNAQDLCDPDVQIDIDVTSDEHPLFAGNGRTCPDAVVQADGTLLLRAESDPTGDGRMYIITVTATDACGNNTASSRLRVSVPAMVGQIAADSGQNFDPRDCLGQETFHKQ